MKEYCPGTKPVSRLPSRGRARETQKADRKKRKADSRNCVHENVSSTSCLCNATSRSLVSSSVSPSHPRAPLCARCSLTLSLSLSYSRSPTYSPPAPSLPREPARIFFFNLIYRQFDGRKTRRHFRPSPASPGPSFHPHVARRKAIKIHNPGHTPRG